MACLHGKFIWFERWPDVGRIAVFMDTSGAMIGIVKRKYAGWCAALPPPQPSPTTASWGKG